MTDQPRENLTFSPDGSFLIDSSSGEKLAQYVESAGAFLPMTAKSASGVEFNPADDAVMGRHTCVPCNCGQKCWKWDKNGNCVGWYQSCGVCCTPDPGDDPDL